MGQTNRMMSREQVQGEEREQKQGEEKENGNGNRNYISGELANSDDTHADLGASMKPPVKSWVQRKRASFELMCASRNEGVYNIKSDRLFLKQNCKHERKKSDLKPDLCLQMSALKDNDENEDSTSEISDRDPNKRRINAESMKEIFTEGGSETKETAKYDDQPCNVVSNDINEKNIKEDILEENVSETKYESKQEEQLCDEARGTDANEKNNYENMSDMMNIEAIISEQTDELIDPRTIKDPESDINEESSFDKVSEPKDDLMNNNQTCNEDVAHDINKENQDENINQSFLSRDEAIKLSTNASGNSQPRLSTIQGSKLLIKHGETDSTCKEDGMDKILDINIEKVNNTMNIIAEELESEDSVQGLPPSKTIKNYGSPNIPGKQAVIPTFGSKDPVVKKMVYNQYREMLRKYTQSSRL